MTMKTVHLCVFVSLLSKISASSLVRPPKTAVVVAFEEQYDLSQLANTLSDEGINSIVIVPTTSNNLYDDLIDVEVIRLDVKTNGRTDDEKAVAACESLLTNTTVAEAIEQFWPTFVIFPALRHDACLLPWARKIKSIPVIWARGEEAESYTFHRTGIAWPIHNGGFWARLSNLFALRSTLTASDSNYVNPASDLVEKYLPNEKDTLTNLYNDVDLVFWGADTILRSETAVVSQLLVEIGCHYCRGVHPVAPELQKELLEFRLGTIAVLLDDDYQTLIEEVAKGLPQGRQGQAVVWKNKNVHLGEDKPENLFVNNDVIRQDLIGYARTRVLLSHCGDTELLETAFHGTPVICFPRTPGEYKNSRRALDLGISAEVSASRDPSEILATIKEIHETATYRENSRRASAAIRDRPLPAVDRITYWLAYIARNKNENKHLSVKDNRRISYRVMHNIDLLIALGFVVGLISGAILPSAYILAGKLLADNEDPKNRSQKPKRKYKS